MSRVVARRLALSALLAAACGPLPRASSGPPGPVDIPIPPLDVPAPVAAPGGGARADPAAPSLGSEAEAAIDEAVREALAAKKLPGCVVVVGRRDAVLFHRAYGARSLEPEVTPMTEDTVFDLASLTKPLATASSLVVLAERGRLDLDMPLRTYLPELGDAGKGTVREALTHTAGFVVDTPMSEYEGGTPALLAQIARHRLRYAPGMDARYSDVGFLVLGELVRRVSGVDLATFARGAVFAPLGMTETGFLPGPALAARAAPTERVDGRWLKGEVHDPRARALGGVAGNAGLFATARDLTRFAQSMLGAPPSFVSASTLRAFTAPHDVPHGVRALGWDVRSAYSTNRGHSLSPRAFGHGGFTGTSLWIDPGSDLFVLFLSNRVHPTGHGEVNPLAGAIADIAARAVLPEPPAVAPSPVMTGLDVLAAERCARLRGKRVGLVTNAAGRTRDGVRDVDLVAHADGVSLVALFAPEHGLSTDADAVIADGRDVATGLPVYSLYGARLSPSSEELAGIDTVVVDLPDVGARFFTYASTLHAILETASKAGVAVVVLDRPDPDDGVHVEGPLLTGKRTFVNHAPLPIRHGMTMGELALYLDATEHLGTALDVVPARGWTREQTWSQTGLPWRPPSPNLKTPAEALLYPGVGMLEATNLSVGRGTETPFELVGAPFVDAPKLAAALAPLLPAGVKAVAATFTPTSSKFTACQPSGSALRSLDGTPCSGAALRPVKFASQACGGVRLTVTDEKKLASVTLGVALAVALHGLYPTEWKVAELAPLLASRPALAAIESGASVDAVVATWRDELSRFEKERTKYLLYPRAGDSPFTPVMQAR